MISRVFFFNNKGNFLGPVITWLRRSTTLGRAVTAPALAQRTELLQQWPAPLPSTVTPWKSCTLHKSSGCNVSSFLRAPHHSADTQMSSLAYLSEWRLQCINQLFSTVVFVHKSAVYVKVVFMYKNSCYKKVVFIISTKMLILISKHSRHMDATKLV